MSETRDPARWSEGEGDEIVALLSEHTPPPMPVALRAELKEKLSARLSPEERAFPRVPVLLALAAAVLLIVWQWPRGPVGPAEIELAAPLVPEPRDAGHDTTDAPAEPPTLLPMPTTTGIGCGLEIRLPLTAVDAGARSIALMVELAPLRHPFRPGHPGPEESGPMSCDGELVAEVPAELFRAVDERAMLSLVYRVRPPTVDCGQRYLVSTCARDAQGRLSTTGVITWPVTARREAAWMNTGHVLTPSGELETLEDRHVVVGAAVEEGFALFETRVRRNRLADVEVVELTLEGGEVAWLTTVTPTWCTERGFVPAGELAIGEHVRGLHGPRRIIDRQLLLGETVAELDVGWPDTYFIDDVLVQDARPGSARPSAVEPFTEGAEPIRVVPTRNDDCSITTRLVLGEALGPDVASLDVLVASHRRPPGSLLAARCADAELAGGRLDRHGAFIAERLPAALVAALREIGAASIELTLPAWDDDGGDWHPDGEGGAPDGPALSCDTPYAVLACLASESGARTELEGALARYSRTGPACFAAGTRVATPEGERPIETLRPGTTVLTLVDGALVEVRVRALLPRGEREVIELGLDDGTVLRVTAEHPLFDAHRADFRPAGELMPGDRLLGPEGVRQIVARAERGERAPVFDLSVDAPHSYLAGGILAHNY